MNRLIETDTIDFFFYHKPDTTELWSMETNPERATENDHSNPKLAT